MDDMSDVLKQFSSIMENEDIAKNLKNALNDFNSSHSNSESSFSNNSTNSPFDGIDISTLLKIKSIFDNFNSKDDPRTNLLLSLKPYLADSKKSKLDQYMQLLNMAKIFETLNNSGGFFK